MKDKIKVSKYTGTHDDSYGTKHDYWVVMENGEEGSVSFQDKDKGAERVTEGKEIEYTLDKTFPKFPKIKLAYSRDGQTQTKIKYDPDRDAYWKDKLELDKHRFEFDSKKQYLIIAQSSQKNAVELFKMLYPEAIWPTLEDGQLINEFKSITSTLTAQVIEIAGNEFKKHKK